MESKITISDIEIVDMRPDIDDPELIKLLPTVLYPQHIKFTLSGVTNAISNAIRRTVMCELLVSAMFAEYDNFKTNDEFIIPEMVISRLRMIPIAQNTPLDAQFQLIAENKTASIRSVKSSEITILYGGKGTKEQPTIKKNPFNETFDICTLDAGRTLQISPITIHQAYGFTSGDGMHALTVNATSIAKDQKPINYYEPEAGGIPSRISNPRVYEISFNTNGSMNPRDIVVLACHNIINRINVVKDLVYSIQNDGDSYLLHIEGESDTIGNLFMKTITELYKDITAVRYFTSSVSRAVTIHIRCDEDINKIYQTTVKYLTEVFLTIARLIAE